MTGDKRRFYLQVGFDVYADNEMSAENTLYTILDELLHNSSNKDAAVEIRNYWPDPYVRDCNKVGRQEREDEE